jgi:hypothetical protein
LPGLPITFDGVSPFLHTFLQNSLLFGIPESVVEMLICL